jgi:hypothetical protein
MGLVYIDYTYQYDQLKQQEDTINSVNEYKKELLEFLEYEISLYKNSSDLFDKGMVLAYENVVEQINQ